MMILKTILDTAGLEPERIWVRWISASEGKLFATIINEMVAELKKLGPNAFKKMWNI